MAQTALCGIGTRRLSVNVDLQLCEIGEEFAINVKGFLHTLWLFVSAIVLTSTDQCANALFYSMPIDSIPHVIPPQNKLSNFLKSRGEFLKSRYLAATYQGGMRSICLTPTTEFNFN